MYDDCVCGAHAIRCLFAYDYRLERSATILGGRRHSVAIGHHDADGRSLDDHIATRGPRAFIGPTEMRLYV